MQGCAVCGVEEFIPYVCRYCGRIHCVYHRLPENHECPNIQQARAPKPTARLERPWGTGLLRTVSNPKLSRIHLRELSALLIALVVLGFSFSIQYLFKAAPLNLSNTVTYLEILLLTLIVIGTGFIGHELAHKFTAQHYGCWAEFKLWTYGAVMALLFAIVSRGTFIFAAPGAVYIASRTSLFGEALDRRTNGVVSIMGPVVNILAAIAFLLATLTTVTVSGPSGLRSIEVAGYNFLLQGVATNLWLGAFNMLPIFILDGQKVFLWNKRTWALLAIPLWIAAFTVPWMLEGWRLSLPP